MSIPDDDGADRRLSSLPKSMMKKANQLIILVVIPVFFLIVSCTGTDSADTPETQPTTTSSLEIATVQPPSLEIDQPGVETVLLEGEVATRTPKPTISPGLFEDGSYLPYLEICHQIVSIMRAHSHSCAPVVED